MACTRITPGRKIWLDTRLMMVAGHALWLVLFGVVSPSKSSAETKICELDVAIGSNEDVVWLDVTMNESHLVDRFDSTDKFSNVEESEMLRKSSQLDQQTHHITS